MNIVYKLVSCKLNDGSLSATYVPRISGAYVKKCGCGSTPRLFIREHGQPFHNYCGEDVYIECGCGMRSPKQLATNYSNVTVLSSEVTKIAKELLKVWDTANSGSKYDSLLLG